MQQITIDNIIKSVVDDLSNPNLTGEYQLVFIADSPFSDMTAYDLHININQEGVPSFALPDGFQNPEDFSTRLESFLMKNHYTFKDALLLLNKTAPEGSEKTWSWSIENNGHLTPVDLRTEAGNHHVDPNELNNFVAGWTINHPKEILLSVYEGLKLLELSSDYANEKNLNRFDIHFILDGVRNSFYARKGQDTQSFSLDQNYYMELFTAFKNGAYIADKTARVLIKFPDNTSYQWDNTDGVLIGTANKDRLAGWDIEFNEKDAEELMEFLTRTEDELDETVNPQERNTVLTSEQANLLSHMLPEKHADDPQLVYFFFVPGNKIISTVLIQDSQRIVELPHVLDKVTEFEDEPVRVLVQTLSTSDQKEDDPFDYYGYEGNKDNWSELGEEDTAQLIAKLNHSL